MYMSNFYFWPLHKLKTAFLQLGFFNRASELLNCHVSSLRDVKLYMAEGAALKAVVSDSRKHIVPLLVCAADNIDTVTSLEGEGFLSLTDNLSPTKKHEELNVA